MLAIRRPQAAIALPLSARPSAARPDAAKFPTLRGSVPRSLSRRRPWECCVRRVIRRRVATVAARPRAGTRLPACRFPDAPTARFSPAIPARLGVPHSAGGNRPRLVRPPPAIVPIDSVVSPLAGRARAASKHAVLRHAPREHLSPARLARAGRTLHDGSGDAAKIAGRSKIFETGRTSAALRALT